MNEILKGILFKIFIVSALIKFNISIDNNLFAVVISTSHTFENYRHSTNSMMFYQYFKKINIPDHKVGNFNKL